MLKSKNVRVLYKKKIKIIIYKYEILFFLPHRPVFVTSYFDLIAVRRQGRSRSRYCILRNTSVSRSRTIAYVAFEGHRSNNSDKREREREFTTQFTNRVGATLNSTSRHVWRHIGGIATNFTRISPVRDETPADSNERANARHLRHPQGLARVFG